MSIKLRLISVVFIFALAVNSEPVNKLGLVIQTGYSTQGGIIYQPNSAFAIAPSLGVVFNSDLWLASIDVSARFYLKNTNVIRHYVFVMPGIAFDESDAIFRAGIGYGFQHDISDVLSIYGQLGIVTNFTSNNSITSVFNPSIGLSAYIF